MYIWRKSTLKLVPIKKKEKKKPSKISHFLYNLRGGRS